ncbi:MAG: transketolase [Lachnospiraceae bacterium]|nr:transketolase [Lachnospiraceae bacterium]
MRSTFINTLTEMSREDNRIVCVIGDTGYSVFEEYEREFGDRFVNVGIAEQNFVSFGAGLAAMGMKPYIYNVVSFMTLRAMEQIVLDVCYQENPVVMIGVGGGFAYATAGPTHHAVMDVAMMSQIPNLTVVCPGDPIEMRAVMLESRYYDKPIYIRIGRSVDPIIHKEEISFRFGRSLRMAEGSDATIYTTGVMLGEAAKAQKILHESGLSVGLVSMPTIKPIDSEVILSDLVEGRYIFTVEEHSILGGLGDSVGRVILENLQYKVRGFKKYGVRDEFAPVTGSREFLDQYYGLDGKVIAEDIKRILNEN